MATRWTVALPLAAALAAACGAESGSEGTTAEGGAVAASGGAWAQSGGASAIGGGPLIGTGGTGIGGAATGGTGTGGLSTGGSGVGGSGIGGLGTGGVGVGGSGVGGTGVGGTGTGGLGTGGAGVGGLGTGGWGTGGDAAGGSGTGGWGTGGEGVGGSGTGGWGIGGEWIGGEGIGGSAGAAGQAGEAGSGQGGAGGAPDDCPGSGTTTYTLDQAAQPTPEEQNAYDLITEAMDTAVANYNCYTDLSRELWVTYNPSVATADGNVNGSIRFGSTASMNHITAMHEIAHVVGVGSWQFGELVVDGIFTGENATAALREITGISDDVLHADSMHFWPYGLNYTTEVSSQQDLINHCLIVQAMQSDF